MLRTFYKSDIAEILKIEESVQISPWSEETFNTCIRAGHIGWVLEEDKQIIGFIIISMTPDECHILNICVAREYQHQGHGKKLLEHVLYHAKTHSIGMIYLEVRQSNSRAIKLYEKYNFKIIGVRKEYYPTVNGREDALILAVGL